MRHEKCVNLCLLLIIKGGLSLDEETKNKQTNKRTKKKRFVSWHPWVIKLSERVLRWCALHATTFSWVHFDYINENLEALTEQHAVGKSNTWHNHHISAISFPEEVVIGQWMGTHACSRVLVQSSVDYDRLKTIGKCSQSGDFTRFYTGHLFFVLNRMS